MVPWLSFGSTSLAAIAVWQLRPAWLIDRLGTTDAWVGAALAPAPMVADESALLQGAPVLVSIDRERALGRVDARFLSLAVDTSQLVGGHFWSASGRVEVGRGSERVPPLDLTRPGLLELARALGPAYLRVGGTEADHVYYSVGAARGSERPSEYELELDEPTWEALVAFAKAAGFELAFTVNAGPSARDAAGAWRSDNAEQLFEFAAERGDSVALWELGNEVNGYWFIHGIANQPSGAQYGRDLWAFRRALSRHFEAPRVAGPASVFFPRLGEPLFAGFDFTEQALAAGGAALDVVTWHYYPQQSRRCPVATRRAHAGHLLGPAELDEVSHWSRQLEQLRDRWAPGASLWLGETGHAQCGGEPGLSDRHASGLWWLDQLGRAARAGQAVVVRQTLIGSDYGLLDGATLAPRPDYFNSLLWRALMGEVVLDTSVSPGNPYLRAYAHCSAQGGGISLLVLNVHPVQPATFEIAGAPSELWRYQLSAPALDSERLFLNGTALVGGRVEDSAARMLALGEPVTASHAERATENGGFAPAAGGGDPVQALPPASYAFFRVPHWGTSVCPRVHHPAPAAAAARW